MIIIIICMQVSVQENLICSMEFWKADITLL